MARINLINFILNFTLYYKPLIGIFAKIFKMNTIKPSSKKLFGAFVPAFKGLWVSLKTERNVQFHFLAIAIVIISGFSLDISILEWLTILLFFGLVLSLELINTAIEKLSDVVQPEKDDRIGIVKDISAAGVLWASILALIAGIIIFTPKIMQIFTNHQ